MVVGRNGQGKTNLLEAVHVLCGLGSHRSTPHAGLVEHGFEVSILRAGAHVNQRQCRVDVEIKVKGGLRLRVNEIPFERTQIHRVLPACVVFSPDDLVLIKGGPEERRSFLDTIITQTNTLGAAHKHNFEKILRQRNGILKAAQFNDRALKQLGVWTDQLIMAAAKLIRDRLVVLKQISGEVSVKYAAVAGKGGSVGVRYRPTWTSGIPEDFFGAVEGSSLTSGGSTELESIQQAMAKGINGSSARDLERGITLVGPHRDDIEITLDRGDARLFASQGEQRTLALAFRLAEYELVAQSRGEEPILLLDDVFSELDESRRKRVAEIVQGGAQAIVTATGAEGLPFESDRVVVVEEGQLRLE